MFYRIVVDHSHKKPYGTVLSRHKKKITADEKLPRQGFATEAVIESEDELSVGDSATALADQWNAEREWSNNVWIMAHILKAEAEGTEPDDFAIRHVADTGLSLAGYRELYSFDARQRLDEEEAQRQATAELAARSRAVRDELAEGASEFQFQFPAVQGIQAGRAYYVAQVPYRFLVRLFKADEEDVPPELRAQRRLNETRAARIGEYITGNPDEYVLPAITVSVSEAMRFEAVEVGGIKDRLGVLQIPMEAALLINDGQHRRAGVERALQANPRLKNETIGVVFFFDEGLARAQQMFADINTKMVKPNSAINALYDQRDPFNRFTLDLLKRVPLIDRVTDKENASVGAKSAKLWSLVAVKKALLRLFALTERAFAELDDTERARLDVVAQAMFEEGIEAVPMWKPALHRSVPASEIREEFVVGHAVFLEALGLALAPLRGGPVGDLREAVAQLRRLAPEKLAECWQGRCVVAGKMNKTGDGVKTTAAAIRRVMGVEVGPALLSVERQHGLVAPEAVGKEEDAA